MSYPPPHNNLLAAEKLAAQAAKSAELDRKNKEAARGLLLRIHLDLAKRALPYKYK